MANRFSTTPGESKIDHSSSYVDISRAADILWTAYGERALERAKLPEARTPTSEFCEKSNSRNGTATGQDGRKPVGSIQNLTEFHHRHLEQVTKQFLVQRLGNRARLVDMVLVVRNAVL